jgi:hypothetical protein
VDAPRRRPAVRTTIVVLAALTIGLFVAGMVYGYRHGEDRPCGRENPVKERPGMLGQTEYLCPDGRTVTQ